ncbi:MAG: hypothetical protein ACTSUE_08350 [Promethearchaeota archaeon]
MFSAIETRKLYRQKVINGECSEECTNWLEKIDEKIAERGASFHNMRYTFPSFSEAAEKALDDGVITYGPDAMDVHKYMTHPGCMEEIKQHYRDEGFTVSKGVFFSRGSPSQNKDFLDIAWNPGWKDYYCDWKDRWFK